MESSTARNALIFRNLDRSKWTMIKESINQETEELQTNYNFNEEAHAPAT
jgi:hypothetical protein